MGSCISTSTYTNVVSIIEINLPSYCYDECLSALVGERTGNTIHDCLIEGSGCIQYSNSSISSTLGFKIIHYFDDYGYKFSNDNRISNSIFICCEHRYNMCKPDRLYLVINCYKSDIKYDNVNKFIKEYSKFKYEKYVMYDPKLDNDIYFHYKRFNKYDKNLLSARNETLITNFIGHDNTISYSSIADIFIMFGVVYNFPDYDYIKSYSDRLVGDSDLIKYYSTNMKFNVIISDPISDEEKKIFIDYIIDKYGANKYSEQVKHAISSRIKFLNINDALNKLYDMSTNSIKNYRALNMLFSIDSVNYIKEIDRILKSDLIV